MGWRLQIFGFSPLEFPFPAVHFFPVDLTMSLPSPYKHYKNHHSSVIQLGNTLFPWKQCEEVSQVGGKDRAMHHLLLINFFINVATPFSWLISYSCEP